MVLGHVIAIASSIGIVLLRVNSGVVHVCSGDSEPDPGDLEG